MALVAKASPDVAGAMNRLGGVYRGNRAQALVARRKAQGFASRKRFDLARRAQQVADSRSGRMVKRDSWEVPMDHFEPALPRRRPNYRDGSGNVVGKRMTGAATGVAKPKKVQGTRTAARTASASIPAVPKFDTRPPIPPDMVGKRDRSHNPEHARQRRLGITTAATGIGGGAAIGSGVRDIRRNSGGAGREVLDRLTREGSEIRERNALIGPLKERTQMNIDRGKAKRPIGPWESRRISDDERKALRDIGQGAHVTRRSGGKLALGAGLLVGSGELLRYGRGRANREWR